MRRAKKLIITGIVIGSLLTSGITYAASQINLVINGQQVKSTVPPQVINGTTMVPLRLVAESLNADVKYDPSTNTVYVNGGQSSLPTDLPLTNNYKPTDLPTTNESLLGKWEGTYVCNNVERGVTLTITNDSTENIEAIFTFYPLKSQSSLYGSFKMSGIYDKDSEILNLKGEEWINQPSNYIMVDLSGKFDFKNNKYSGAVIGSGSSCKDFNLYQE